MKHLLKLFTLLICLLSACKKDETLKIGVSADNGEYSSMKENDFYGFEIEMAKKLARYLDKDYKFIDMNFHTLIPALQVGDLDLVIASVGKTQARDKLVSFSSEYLPCNTLLCLSTNIDGPSRVDSIKELDTSENNIFVGQTGSLYHKLLESDIKKGKVKSIDSIFQTSQEINDNSKYNIYLLYDAETVKALQNNDLYKREVKVIEINESKIPGYSILVNKDDKDLLKKVNSYINTKYEQEDKQQLMQQFFPEEQLAVSV